MPGDCPGIARGFAKNYQKIFKNVAKKENMLFGIFGILFLNSGCPSVSYVSERSSAFPN